MNRIVQYVANGVRYTLAPSKSFREWSASETNPCRPQHRNYGIGADRGPVRRKAQQP